MSVPQHIFALGLLVLVILTFGRHAESFVNTVKNNFSPYQTPATLSQTHLFLQIVTTLTEQEKGLSGREAMPSNAGMLFAFAEPTVPAFWMKEMKFPLDLIWLDANQRVVGISSNLSPKTYPQTFSSGRPIQYVLEVNAGWAAKNKIRLGNYLQY